MEIDFAFRTEKDNEIGSGHFFRSLSLAVELQKQNFKILFLISNKNGIEILQKTNIPYSVLKGNTEIEHIRDCKLILTNAKKIIIDLPIKFDNYCNQLNSICDVILLDDLGNKTINSKILINGSIVKKYHYYNLNKKNSRIYLGPEYMMIRKEFFDLREKLLNLNKTINKILLIFGGEDDQDIIRKIIPFFYDKKYQISIIVGRNYAYIEELNDMTLEFSNISINISPENIAELFTQQDLVISSSGITSYELATLGIPTIFVPVVEHQEPTAAEFSKKGFGINYGRWDSDFKRLENTIIQMESLVKRKKMYNDGRKIIDGEGISRVLKIII